mgnify:CR=1 FL=1
MSVILSKKRCKEKGFRNLKTNSHKDAKSTEENRTKRQGLQMTLERIGNGGTMSKQACKYEAKAEYKQKGLEAGHMR